MSAAGSVTPACSSPQLDTMAASPAPSAANGFHSGFQIPTGGLVSLNYVIQTGGGIHTSGGKATIANMFVNMNTGRRGLVAQYDVICFDEVSGVSFDQKEGVNILKGYMESGEFSRGKESIRADGGIVMVGNFDVDVEHQQRVGHLFSPMPAEMRNDCARLYANASVSLTRSTTP